MSNDNPFQHYLADGVIAKELSKYHDGLMLSTINENPSEIYLSRAAIVKLIKLWTEKYHE